MSEHVQGADGFYYTHQGRRLCEDCWREIPTYVDFPLGLTSPESDGDREGRNAKRRPAAVEGKEGIEALRKAVCLDCYYLAFKRHYPGAVCAEFSRAIRHMEIVQDPVPEVSYMPDPTLEVHR